MSSIIFKHLGTKLTNSVGTFYTGGYRIRDNDGRILNHLLLYKSLTEPVPLRIQSGCLTGDIFGDTQCDCHAQLVASMERLERFGNGLITYTVEHDGRGRGTIEKMMVYAKREETGMSSREVCDLLGIPYERRSYNSIAFMLHDMGIHSVQLLSQNPGKAQALSEAGLLVISTEIVEVNHQ